MVQLKHISITALYMLIGSIHASMAIPAPTGIPLGMQAASCESLGRLAKGRTFLKRCTDAAAIDRLSRMKDSAWLSITEK
jgi:hypothetical protein